VWDSHLARTGSELVAARVELVEALRPLVRDAYAALAPGAPAVELTYRSRAGVDALPDDREAWEAALLSALSEARSEEIDRGQCLVGPHRDELVLALGSLPARGYASQGESWSLALALRLASFDLLVEETDSPPVLLLDDVFAELDDRRREHLAERVSDADQVLVTAAVEADVPSLLSGSRFMVGAGEVSRA
jgi:DNA replication and repair protein RecF